MPPENFYTALVAEQNSNQRIDVFLTQRIKGILSRSLAAKILSEGFVLVNGKTILKSSHKVFLGDKIAVNPQWFEKSSEPSPNQEKIPLNILFEDNHIIVINKPAGLVVHPGAGVKSGTLVNAILAHCGHTLPSLGLPSRAGIVHRLDKNTSGVMVVAKSQEALTQLSQMFSKHEQKRIYHALVIGNVLSPQTEVCTGHGRDPNNRLKFKALPKGEGKNAVTFFKKLENYEQFSLLECKLQTGRTHQIRIHCQHLKHPIIHDTVYCNKKISLSKEKINQLNEISNRQMLHASLLGFFHPVTKKYQEFVANWPEDFENTYKFLKHL
jgi:23S rRNA pseudouridine1911/1915/1917 synthase